MAEIYFIDKDADGDECLWAAESVRDERPRAVVCQVQIPELWPLINGVTDGSAAAVELVARTLFDLRSEPAAPTWADLNELTHSSYRDEARYVLDALRGLIRGDGS